MLHIFKLFFQFLIPFPSASILFSITIYLPRLCPLTPPPRSSTPFSSSISNGDINQMKRLDNVAMWLHIKPGFLFYFIMVELKQWGIYCSLSHCEVEMIFNTLHAIITFGTVIVELMCVLYISTVWDWYKPWYVLHLLNFSHISLLVDSYTAKTQYQKFETSIPNKEIVLCQSQFPHSCVCQRFIIPTIGLPILLLENKWTDPGNR